ncbi:MAG: c-type cytochrome [Elusimicrobiota bacterium]
MRKAFYLLNFLLLGSFLAALVVDQDRDWKDYQKKYYRMEAESLRKKLESAPEPEKAELRAQLASFERRPLEIKQIIVDDLGRVDRCITCHAGMDEFTNPSMTTGFSEHPFVARRGDAHKTHDFKRFGCTSCHEGQGLALTPEAGHGKVKHWERPLLAKPYIEASCVRCHGNFEKLAGAQTAALGKRLFEKNGCIGCHSLRGVGGSISVDLGDIADKPLSRIDFSGAGLKRLDWNIQNWIELHLTKDPMQLSPGDPEGHLGEPIPPSGMPPFYETMKPEEASAITAYLMSMSEESVPHKYFVYAPPAPAPRFPDARSHGKAVFEKYGCAGCHGLGGAAGRRNFNARGPNQTKMEEGREPTLVDTVGTFSREELVKKIQDGVPSTAVAKFKEGGPTPPLYMPSWKERIQGKELEDLVTYLLSIAKKEEAW